jgi:recombination protein U
LRENTDKQRYQNAVNNAQGQSFEGYIKAACAAYNIDGRAEIDKTPEPFRVMSKQTNGIFSGRFTARAQPDFQGTLAGGRSIVFEAKYTTTDRVKRDALTDEQMKRLARHEKLGALVGICAGIGDKFFFIPWWAWRDMKQIYGRKYVTAADVEQYRVRFTGAVMFLDYVTGKRSEGG